jgi:hypothetical protein
VIRIRPEHVESTLDVLRSCGGGRRECVAYWVSDVQPGHDDAVREVVHPRHLASGGGYEVEGAWLTAFFLDLAARHRRAVAQVHTHPSRWTHHSWIDDEFVLVPTPGFVSIIVPDFATGGSSDITAWGIHELQRDGSWKARPELIAW